LEHLRQEEAELSRKLDAVRGVIAVYAPAEALKPMSATQVSSALVDRAVRASKDTYSSDVREIAADVIRNAAVRPVPTKRIVEAVKARGVAIRGQNELNAVSALLSRSPAFVSNGRIGWTLAVSQSEGHGSDENEAPSGGAAGASEAGWTGIRPYHQPELTHS
jgi:hypothetical protein